MDFLVILVCLVVVALVFGVPIYFLFFGSAGRSWRGIKEHDKWEREKERKKREGR